MAFTKVAPAGIGSTPGDGYRIGDSFLHSTGVEITNINATGILTAASLDISGAIDFDGQTNLDHVSIAGVTTIAAGGKLAIGNVVPSKMLELNSGGVVASIHESTGGSYVEAQFKNSSRHYILGLRPDQSSAFCILDNTSGSGGVLLKASGHTVTLDHNLDVDGHTDLDNVSVAGVTTFSGDVVFSGDGDNIIFDKSTDDLIFNDGVKAIFGTSSDGVQIYHASNNSHINDTGTGDLILDGSKIRLRLSGSTQLETDTNGIIATGTAHRFQSGTSGDCELIIEADTDNNNETDNPRILFRQDGGNDWSAIGTNDNILEISNSVGSGGISFKTAGTNGYQNAVERLRITSGGHVNIGGNYTQTSYRLHVDGGIEATAAFACVKSVSISGIAPQIIFTDTNQDSDYTIKNDFGSLQFIDRTNSNTVRMYANTGGFGGTRLYIADDIVHTGDTDTRIEFGTDTINFDTAGSERLRITSDGQIGVNNTSPDGWHTSYRSIQLYDAGVLYGSTDDSFVGLGANHYLNTGGNFIYSNSDFASRFYQVNGEFYFEGAASGSAGGSFSFTQRLRITSTGQIRIDQATSANNGIRMRPSGWNYDFRMGAVGSSGGHIWLGQNWDPTGGTRDSASYGTNYIQFTTGGEINFGTGATNTNPTARIKITNNGFVGINEGNPQTTLNVRGTISTGRNVAREVGTVISQSGNYSGSRTATNVLNGNKNYEYGYDWLVGPSSGTRTNAYLVIDLGQAYTCDRFVIYNQNEYDHSNREVKNFTLEGSNDNSSWTTLLDDDCGCSHGHEPNPGFSFRLPEGNAYGIDDTEGVSYRYWRFTMKTFHGSDGYGGVTELELYEVGNTAVSANKVGSEICTHSLVAGDISTQRMNGIQMLTSSEGLNIHTGQDASDTWEITEYNITTNGSFIDKSTIRHKRGVMAVSSSYNTGDLYIRIDNLYNLPGNAWWTFGLWIMTNQTIGTLSGHHSAMIHVVMTGLGSWSSMSANDIQGSKASSVSVDSHGTNFVELKVDVSDSSRGPCTVLCNGGTFDPPRISFH